MARTVLVTGGAGFIGSHVVDALVDRGCRVLVLDSLVPQVHGNISEPRFLNPTAEFIRTDLCDTENWAGRLADVDAVVHLAAEVGVGQSMYEIVRYTRGNTLATAVLLEALLPHREHISRLVVASSMSIYGEGAYECPNHGQMYPQLRSAQQLERHEWEMRCPDCGTIVRAIATPETKPLYPTSIYAVNKRDHEEMFLAFGRAYHVSAIALRFFNVYGSRQALSNPYTGVGAIFSGRLLKGKAPIVFEDGQQARDFVHISDIVQGVLLALETDRVEYDVFNVGSGETLTVLELAAALAREIGIDLKPEITQQFRAGDIRHCFSDISKIQLILGYEPRIKFADGVRELIDWVRGESVVDHVGQAYRELASRGLAS